MSTLRMLYKTGLKDAQKMTEVLKKIRILAAEKSQRLNVRIDALRIRGNELASFTIDETLATGTIVLDLGPGRGRTAGSATFQDLTYTAKVQPDGFFPNDVQIEYIEPLVDGPLSVAVVGRTISVTLAVASGLITSTADDVKAAIIANAAANALVAVSGTGATALTAQALTGLTGGSSVQTYDKADIYLIKRLRTKKYLIVLNGSADPAP